MKKLIVIVFMLCMSCFLLNAQDIITLKNGDEIKVKVTEVNTTEIKYKKFDNPDGPVYTAEKNTLFMIKYENGSKDVFNSEDSSKKNKSTFKEKSYAALVYVGMALPMGQYGDESAGTKIGFTVGHDGDVHLSSNSVYFTYNVNYTFNPYSYGQDNVFGPSNHVKGNYGLIYALAGLKIKTNTNPASRFYFFFNGGINQWLINGDLAGSTSNFGSFRISGGNGFALSMGAGVEINNKFNFGLRYFNSKPKVKISVSYYDPYNNNLYSDSFEAEQKIELLQFVLGYQF